MYELIVEASFSAAHNLRGYEGACENLHGHNWRVEAVVASSKLDGIGMALDFKKLKAALKGVLERLDHKYINECAPFDKENPTAENISRYIYVELSKAVFSLGVKVARVRVWESDNASAVYYE